MSLESSKKTRREFCARTCQALSVGALGALAHACGGSPTAPDALPSLATINAAAANGAIVLTIDSASPLATVGNAALVQTSSGNVLVARTAASSFTALTAVCTHQACTVSEYQNQIYECPCHGSQFSTSGAVVRGPAAASLRPFATAFANNSLTITLA